MKVQFKVTFQEIKVDDFTGFRDTKIVKSIKNTSKFQINFRDAVQRKFDNIINIDFSKVPKVIKDNKFVITVDIPNTKCTIDNIKETIINIDQIVVETKVDRINFGFAYIKTYIEVV